MLEFMGGFGWEGCIVSGWRGFGFGLGFGLGLCIARNLSGMAGLGFCFYVDTF